MAPTHEFPVAIFFVTTMSGRAEPWEHASELLKSGVVSFSNLRVVRSPEDDREEDQPTPAALRGCGYETCRKGSLCRTSVCMLIAT